jgi:hypothetical protein
VAQTSDNRTPDGIDKQMPRSLVNRGICSHLWLIVAGCCLPR